jgi:hypothetical protein
MRDIRYCFSSLYLEPPTTIVGDILHWGRKHIYDNEIFVGRPNQPGGRENQIHITVLYGIRMKQEEIIRNVLQDTPLIPIKLGAVDFFVHHDLYDVMVLKVESDGLRLLNRRLRENVAYEDKYDEFNPHVTIAFVKKNSGWRHYGKAYFSDISFVCDNVVFAPEDGQKQPFQLGKRQINEVHLPQPQ